MSNKFKDISIKIKIYHFFDHMINIKIFDTNNIKIDEKSYKNIFIYCIGYVTINDLKYVKINNVNSLRLIFIKISEYFEEINENKCLTLVPTNESKERLKKYKELWSKSEI